jgi:hypothetical protein
MSSRQVTLALVVGIIIAGVLALVVLTRPTGYVCVQDNEGTVLCGSQVQP